MDRTRILHLVVVSLIFFVVGQLSISQAVMLPPWMTQELTCSQFVKEMKYDFASRMKPPMTSTDYFFISGTLNNVLLPMDTCTKLNNAVRRRSSKRKKRTVGISYFNFPEAQWPRNITYTFDVGKGAHSPEQKNVISQQLRRWSEKTCITFTEQDYKEPSPDDDHHAVFTKGTGCISFVGKGEVKAQPVYLADSCFDVPGEILATIGSLLGIWPAVQHSKRDEKTKINYDKVKNNEAGNFIKIPDELKVEEKHNFGSISYPHCRVYSSDPNSCTIETKDPLFQRTIGQRSEINFYDAKLINKYYCGDVCDAFEKLSCMNDGYQDPLDCTKCRCVDGYTGRLCDMKEGSAESEGAVCGGDVIIWDGQQEISSPGYFSPGFYENGIKCVWNLKASDPSKKIQMRFDPDFGVYCSPNEVCYQWVEVRSKDQLGLSSEDPIEGFRECCRNLLSDTIISEGPEAQIIFKSQGHVAVNQADRRGFRLYINQYPQDFITPPPPPSCASPCQNGGSCVNGRCQCLAGFIGTYCETEEDPCSTQPCLNGGTCLKANFGFICRCPAGWTGLFCNVADLPPVCPRPCQNGGTCYNGVCICLPDFSGEACDIVDPCRSGPCRNGGTCLPFGNSFRCTCTESWEGPYCDIDKNDCDSRPCYNGATCLDLLNGFLCYCPPGWNGKICDIEDDPCLSDPCRNGGACQSRVGGFTCTCRDNWTGPYCEISSNGNCNPNPCKNGGTCVNTANGPECRCQHPFSGPECERAQCGGCDMQPGMEDVPCEDQTELETVKYCCPRQASYETDTFSFFHFLTFFRKRETRTRTVYQWCTKQIPKRYCCDNAVLVGENYLKECVVLGTTEWDHCIGKCGGCGTQRRFSYYLEIKESGQEKLECKQEIKPCAFDVCRQCSFFESILGWCNCPCCTGYEQEGDMCVESDVSLYYP